MEPDQVLKICLQDLDFYQESGGGVTLSGGECFCQNDFCEDLIRLLHGQNIPVAAETTGYVPEEVFRSLAPMFDLLLFDDPEERVADQLQGLDDQHFNVLPEYDKHRGKRTDMQQRFKQCGYFGIYVQDRAENGKMTAARNRKKLRQSLNDTHQNGLQNIQNASPLCDTKCRGYPHDAIQFIVSRTLCFVNPKPRIKRSASVFFDTALHMFFLTYFPAISSASQWFFPFVLCYNRFNILMGGVLCPESIISAST